MTKFWFKKNKMYKKFLVSNQKVFSGEHNLPDDLFFTRKFALAVVSMTYQKKNNDISNFRLKKCTVGFDQMGFYLCRSFSIKTWGNWLSDTPTGVSLKWFTYFLKNSWRDISVKYFFCKWYLQRGYQNPKCRSFPAMQREYVNDFWHFSVQEWVGSIPKKNFVFLLLHK